MQIKIRTSWPKHLSPPPSSHTQTHTRIHTHIQGINISWLCSIQKFMTAEEWFQLLYRHLTQNTKTCLIFFCSTLLLLSYRRDSWTHSSHAHSHITVSPPYKLLPSPPESLTDLMYEAWSLKRSHKGFLFSHSSTSFSPFTLSSSRSDFSWTTTQKHNMLVYGMI